MSKHYSCDVECGVLRGEAGGSFQHHSSDTQRDYETVITGRLKRTPPKVEVLLRRYNSQGITKWDEILEGLQKENPPFYLKRSTLGEYLKECNLGTSRRNQMDDDEMRQVILCELSQPRSRNCGVRKVWKTLKANGHHIKRDFVEKVMKEVNPEGFSKRRPKWTLPNTSVADSAPKHTMPVLPEPPRPSEVMDTASIHTPLPSEAQLFSVSFPPSPTTMELLIQGQIFTAATRTNSDLLRFEPEGRENTDSHMDLCTKNAGENDRGSIHGHDAGGMDFMVSGIISEQDTAQSGREPRDGPFEFEPSLPQARAPLAVPLAAPDFPQAPPPTEFNHAIQYINNIKTRFADEPETYRQFLEILQTYKREQCLLHDVYAQVAQLFRGTPDLIDEFKMILPETGAGANATKGLFRQ